MWAVDVFSHFMAFIGLNCLHYFLFSMCWEEQGMQVCILLRFIYPQAGMGSVAGERIPFVGQMGTE